MIRVVASGASGAVQRVDDAHDDSAVPVHEHTLRSSVGAVYVCTQSHRNWIVD